MSDGMKSLLGAMMFLFMVWIWLIGLVTLLDRMAKW
jgi:hypothetical protein